MIESKFQSELIDELKDLFPNCIVLKNDTSYIQGIPDLLILYKNKWAALECKKSLYDSFRPNQQYYLEIMDNMSFASMICPENREAVLYELQQSFSIRRVARFSRCK
jgi:hypothetical protein